MTKEFVVQSPEDFSVVIDFILETNHASGLCIVLRGDLGAGKTTFTQQLAKRLGVSEPVTSPTFTIMKQYSLRHAQFSQLVHIDAYRFEDESEAKPLQLERVLEESQSIVCVEWPERIASIIPSNAVSVSLVVNADESRTVRVDGKEDK